MSGGRRSPHDAASPADSGTELSSYRVDLSPALVLPEGTLDDAGVPCTAPTKACRSIYHPTTVGQYALAHWNAYLESHDERHTHTFMTQARWLVTNEVRVDPDGGGWAVPYDGHDRRGRGPWLSAASQGTGVSVLLRAHLLTADDDFIQPARRAVRTFMRDILDGGVSTSLWDDGVYFEDVAAYPAAHVLHAHLFGLFGLYDYAAVTGDAGVTPLIERGVSTLQKLIDAYDSGYWSRHDLLTRRLASRFYHALHVAQLKALAEYSGDARWAALAARWEAYELRLTARIRELLARHAARGGRVLTRWLRHSVFGSVRLEEQTPQERVVVPITAFPVTGGMREVLEGVSHVMADEWQMDYLTRDVGPHASELAIHRFGFRLASPWHFPTVWLYAVAGASALFGLLRNGRVCRLVLPQDSVFTGAFSALAGKVARARVVCIEHGTVTFPYSTVYHQERLAARSESPWPLRLIARLELALYWPSLRILARITARFADHFLVAGEESAEVYIRQLGVHPSRITRWRFMVDAERYRPLDPVARRRERSQRGIDRDAIVVAIVARLSPAKGLDIALQGLGRALSLLPAALAGRVHIILAGDGPLRPQVEADLRRFGLEGQSTFMGETSAEEVRRLLGLTDIFLYTSTRGTNFSMAVLEAMAAGCAVIASTEPRSNQEILSDGRGLAIKPGDTESASAALVQLIGDLPRCREMGTLARAYVARFHTPAAFRRSLLRATFWS